MILITICSSFGMKPKQAAALLTNNNQYLLHSVVKGIKGRFDPIIHWFKSIYSLASSFEEILNLEFQVSANHKTLLMILNTFKTGYFSHSPEVAIWCSKAMVKFGKCLIEGNLAK